MIISQGVRLADSELILRGSVGAWFLPTTSVIAFLIFGSMTSLYVFQILNTIDACVTMVSLERGWAVLYGTPSLAAMEKSSFWALFSFVQTVSAAFLTVSCVHFSFLDRAWTARSDMLEMESGMASFFKV